MATVKADPMLKDLRGKLGNVVFIPQPGGVIQLRERKAARNPRSQPQLVWRDAMRQAGRTYQELSFDEHAAWKAYAESVSEREGKKLKTVNVYIKLSARFLLISPGKSIPKMPPAGAPLTNDSLKFTVKAKKGGAVFTASKKTSRDTVAELLVHKIASPHNRTYLEKYRSKGFSTFDKPCSIELLPGWYACGIRYARRTTGEFGEIQEVARIKVEPS